MPADPMVRRARLLLAYDGTDFAGVAPNPGVRTVVGEIAAHLERRQGRPVALTVAGRTDRGVHAWGQVAHVDLAERAGDLAAVVRSMNSALGPEIVVRDAQWVDRDFDARFSARDRRYRYRVHTGGPVAPWNHRYVWAPRGELDVDAMQQTADGLLGRHDFSSLCRRPAPGGERPAPSLVREVTWARWTLDGDELAFDVTAPAFCQQMVRSMVGLCVAAGLGRHDPVRTAEVLAARDRNAVPLVAPPSGLTLMEVRYPEPYRWASGLAAESLAK